jgi:4-hydroxybenzoate polyprenyltransferase
LSPATGWVHSLAPYAQLARLDKPIGTWLLFWPCAWGVAVGGGGASGTALREAAAAVASADAAVASAIATTVDMSMASSSSSSLAAMGLLLAQFGMGSILLRGAGCTINDLWDQDIDRNVARTSSRPLASGQVTQRQALQFLMVQLALGAGVLASLPNLLSTALWSIASLPLVAIYPTTKRYFPVPQLVLGLAINWGAFVGYAATRGCVDCSVVLPLYLSGVTWTVLYDTIYAHQDKADDAKLGLRSSALTFGKDTNRQTTILTGLATVTYGQWLYVAVMGDPTLNLSEQSAIFWLSSAGGMSVAYAHLLWQVHTLDYASPQSCLERFRSNQYTGGLVFASLLATKLSSTIGNIPPAVATAASVM